MTGLAVIYAPEDAQLANGIVQACSGGLVVCFPIETAARLRFGDGIVRALIWSAAAAGRIERNLEAALGVDIVLDFGSGTITPSLRNIERVEISGELSMEKAASALAQRCEAKLQELATTAQIRMARSALQARSGRRIAAGAVTLVLIVLVVILLHGAIG